MSNDSFKVKKSLTLTPQDLTLLVNPEAGDLACDINDLNKIKRYDVNTLGWTEVGSGSGVGNVNALLTQTFDTAALAQFTQTGLALTTSNPIDGTQSARLIHQAASSQSFKQVIAVDRKYRGDLMAMSLQVRSSATSGNLTLLVTDETNSAVIMASSSISTGQYQVATAVTNSTTTISGFSNVDINLLKVGMTITGAGIPTATVISSINTTANTIVISQAATASATITAKFSALPDRKSFSFTIPTNCASLSYTVTALQEAGLPESYVDDVVIELANVSLLETSVTVPNITSWTTFVPTVSHDTGAMTNYTITSKVRQVGENLEVVGFIKFSAASAAFSGLNIILPSNYTIDTSKLPPANDLGVALGDGSSYDVGSNLIPNKTYYNTPQAVQVRSLITNSGLNPIIVNGAQPFSNTTPFPFGATDQINFNFTAPIVQFSASSSVSIPLTQSGLVQEADSALVAASNASQVITVATTPIPFTFTSSTGSALSYNGSSFTINQSGIYEIATAVLFTTAASRYISLYEGTSNQLIAITNSMNGTLFAGSTTRFLTAGLSYSLRANDGGGTLSPSGVHYLSVTKQGSLKQVTVNANSKITIPTSELRFEGSSSRGSTDTAIVKFDTQAKIRGDAFSVVNTAANGTVITMLKAGKLDISAALLLATGGGVLSITKNQTNLTITPVTNEALTRSQVYTATAAATTTTSVYVNIGDVFRISADVALTSNGANNFNLTFQEQEIQVSVSNTLPQFSESDSSVRLLGANGYGSTATKIRRFSSTDQNIGSDIEYTDSAANGGSFVVKTSGVYEISYSDNLTTSSYIGVSKNAASLTTNISGINDSTALAIQHQSAANAIISVNWSGSLVQGDVIRAHTDGVASGTGPLSARFAISKVGKPNVTGVNVTPFVNVPQPVSGDASWTGYNGSSGSGYQLFDSALTMNGNSIFAADNTDGNGIKFLKSANITASFMRNSQLFNNSACDAAIYIDGTIVANNRAGNGGTGNSSSLTVTYSGPISAGQVLRFASTTSAPTYGDGYLKANVLATALSDQILTAPETFSTDTASLQYASSSTYTLSTLANAPVGTFITFTVAANTVGNVRTQTTVAPTQTLSSMQSDGILLYGRAYNASSTALQPASIAIQIGKGLKGSEITAFTNAGKSVSLPYNSTPFILSGNSQYGVWTNYNEKTGILELDCTYTLTNAITSGNVCINPSLNLSIQNAYLVVNASKNPSILGLGIGTVAARGVNSSGQSIPSNVSTTMIYNSTKTYDVTGSLNTATGIFTAPESGYYNASWSCLFNMTANLGQVITSFLFKNGALFSAGAYNTMDRAVIIDAGSNGSCGIYLNKGDLVEVKVFNNRAAGATSLALDTTYNYFSIHKTSVGTGN